MKIVCDSCATKYSIADEKVRGKVFKIRCKKCSHIIVVKGTEGGEEGATVVAAAPRGDSDISGAVPSEAVHLPSAAISALPPDEPAVWHLVINREQIGPITAGEVKARLARGEIDGETYGWREGFGDWSRLAAIEDFASAAAASSSAAAAPAVAGNGHAAPSDATRRASADELFSAGNGGEDEADAFRGPQPAAHAPAAQPRSAGMPSGIFASAAPPSNAPASAASAPDPFGGGELGGPDSMAASNAPSPRVDAGKMTGQRSENSVLFSLNNLQALTVGSGGPGATPSNGGARPGHADRATEGSGLIDIRAMAAMHLGGNKPMAADAPRGGDLLDDVPLFSPSAAAPVLVPMVSSTGTNKKLLYALFGFAGLLLLLIVVMIWMLLRHPTAPVMAENGAESAQQAAAKAGAGSAAAPAAPAAGGEEATAQPSKGTEAAQNDTHAGAPAAAVPRTAETAAGQRADHRHGGGHEGGEAPAAHGGGGGGGGAMAAAPAPAPPPPSPARHGGGGDDLDQLLGGATGGGGSHAAPAAAAAPPPAAGGGGTPLSRSDVMNGFGGVSGRVHGCFSQYHMTGTVFVSVRIQSSGRASDVSVGGPLAGTAEGGCVASAVRGARWRSGAPELSVRNYPYVMR